MITLEDGALIRRLAADGVPHMQIAKRLAISRNTVARAVGHAGGGDRGACRLVGVVVVPGERRALRPDHRRVDPADRLVWSPGDAAQCDLRFPPKPIPLEDGTRAMLPVLVMVPAYSRFICALMVPTRQTCCWGCGRSSRPSGGCRAG